MTTPRKIWLQSSSSDADAAIWRVYQQSAQRHARALLGERFDFEFHGVSRTFPGVDQSDSAFHLASREVVRNAILAEQQGYALTMGRHAQAVFERARQIYGDDAAELHVVKLLEQRVGLYLRPPHGQTAGEEKAA